MSLGHKRVNPFNSAWRVTGTIMLLLLLFFFFFFLPQNLSLLSQIYLIFFHSLLCNWLEEGKGFVILLDYTNSFVIS